MRMAYRMYCGGRCLSAGRSRRKACDRR